MNNRIHFILNIEGMTCDGCKQHVIQALKDIPGVEDVQVGDWREGTAVVIADNNVP